MKSLIYIGIIACLSFGGNDAIAQINTPNSTTAIPSPVYQLSMPSNYPSGIKTSYVRTTVMKTTVTNPANIAGLAIDKKVVVTNYSDGIGRPVQTVVNKMSSQTQDIVSVSIYDSFGRSPFQLLPYTSNTNQGGFKKDVFTAQPSFYNSNFTDHYNPYSKTLYDDSSLSRGAKQMIPGSTHVGANVGQQTAVRLNSANEEVKKWRFNAGNLPSVVRSYNDSELYVAIVTDESNKRMISYQDRDGKVVMRKTEAATSAGVNHQGWLCTYFVYDEMNRLRYVLQPKLIDTLQAAAYNWTLTQSLADELSYSYDYDYKGRVITKKTPGQAATYILYDPADRPVMVQDGKLAATNSWQFIKYDVLGRTILTGKFLNTAAVSRSTLAQQLQSDNPTNSFISFLRTVVTVNDYTTSSTVPDGEIHTISYFDNYDHTPSAFSYHAGSVQNIPSVGGQMVNPQSTETMTKATGGYVRIMDGTSTTSQWEAAVMYYDDRGRIIQTQSLNSKGGYDTVSMKYDFTGKLLATVSSQNNPTVTSGNIGRVKLTKIFSYNGAGQLTFTRQKLNDEPYYRTINYMTYDALGRLSMKKLGNTVETQNYTYRIWGALEGINKDYCVSGTGDYFFGELISYDYGYTSLNNLNMPSGMRWRMAGSSNIQRSYGYKYDVAKRLTTADYVQTTNGTTWTNGDESYTAENMKYDGNGNLTRMDQWATKVGYAAPFKMDQMTYTYMNGGKSNRLQSVSDAINQSYDLGEFTEPANQTTPDYDYDDNGNAVQDKNRNITSISYTHLNKPYEINFTNNRKIKFTYDAAGVQLSKQIIENNQVQQTIDYVGGMEYRNGVLTSIPHDEGRVRPVQLTAVGTNAASWGYEYDYFVRDHQGNVRSTLSEEPDSNWLQATLEDGNLTFTPIVYNPSTTHYGYSLGWRQYLVTSELMNANVEEQTFENVSETRDNKPESNNINDQKAARLNAEEGSIIGPSMMLRVMAGDKISISTSAYYSTSEEVDYSSNATPARLGEALVAALTGDGGYNFLNESGIEAELTQNSITNSRVISAMQDLKNSATSDGQHPQAFLNYIMLDDKMNVINEHTGFVQTTAPDAWNELTVDEFQLKHSGYIIVFLSNESQMDVSFDNLTVNHWKGKLLDESHYYPYGLTLTSQIYMQSLQNDVLYASKQIHRHEFSDGSGLEWYNFGARQYDAQVGTWHSADPLAESSADMGQYVYCNSNPVVFSDPTGMKPYPRQRLANIYSNGGGSGLGFGQISPALMMASGYGYGYSYGFNSYTGSVGLGAGNSVYYDWGTGQYMAGNNSITSTQAVSYYANRFGGVTHYNNYLSYAKANPDNNQLAYLFTYKDQPTIAVDGTSNLVYSKNLVNIPFSVSNVTAGGLQLIQICYGTRRNDGVVVGNYTWKDAKGDNDGFVDGGINSPIGETVKSMPYFIDAPLIGVNDVFFNQWNGTDGFIRLYDRPSAWGVHEYLFFETAIVATNYLFLGQDRLLGVLYWGFTGFGAGLLNTTFYISSDFSQRAWNILKKDYPNYNLTK